MTKCGTCGEAVDLTGPPHYCGQYRTPARKPVDSVALAAVNKLRERLLQTCRDWLRRN